MPIKALTVSHNDTLMLNFSSDSSQVQREGSATIAFQQALKWNQSTGRSWRKTSES